MTLGFSYYRQASFPHYFLFLKVVFQQATLQLKALKKWKILDKENLLHTIIIIREMKLDWLEKWNDVPFWRSMQPA